MRLSRCLVAAALAVVASAVPALPAPASAAPSDDIKISVQPSGPAGPTSRSHFIYALPPGGHVSDLLGVSNLGGKPVTVAVYPTDAYTTVDGSFSLLPGAQQPRDVGSWVTVKGRRFTIPPGKRMDIPFTLTVPAGAEPGDHPGGILASVVSQERNADGNLVNVDRRVAARVYLRVNGVINPGVQVETLNVDYDNPIALFGGGMTVTYRVRNTGNARVQGQVQVEATGPLGLRLGDTGKIPVKELLPGSQIEVTRKIPGVFPAFRIGAETVFDGVTVADGKAVPAARASTGVWAVPWLLVVLVVLVAAAVVAIAIRRRRRVSASPSPGPAPAAVSAGARRRAPAAACGCPPPRRTASRPGTTPTCGWTIRSSTGA